MRLVLVRHGETVDNVAGLYAGIRDSKLTNHGILQADRLASHLTDQGLTFSHIYASDLQRARITAEALVTAQISSRARSSATETIGSPLSVVEDVLLQEQDFGFYEGKPFYARDTTSLKSGKDNHRSQHINDPDFQDVESKESMRKRADAFVESNLVPLLCQAGTSLESNVAIFSHGIILNHLWRSILGLFGRSTVSLAPGVSVGNAGSTPLEYLGGWSNTGYLELEIYFADAATLSSTVEPPKSASSNSEAAPGEAKDKEDLPLFPDQRMKILTINGKEHLRALKRTRGVGSAAHDEGQKRIDTFFKKPKKP